MNRPASSAGAACIIMAATVLVSVPALAQATQSGSPPGVTSDQSSPPSTAPMTGTRAPQERLQSPIERVEARIKLLHSELSITSAQEPEWTAFAGVMRDNATHMEQRLNQRSTTFAKMTAVANLDSYAAIAQEHASDMRRLADAFRPLYASFSEEQKATADAIFRHRPPPHRAGTQGNR